MAQPTILLVTAADRDAINSVLEGWGKGPNNISRELVAAGTAAPTTHWLGLDMGADAEYAQDLRDLAESEDYEFWAYTAAGPDVNGLAWAQTVMADRGLEFKPEEV